MLSLLRSRFAARTGISASVEGGSEVAALMQQLESRIVAPRRAGSVLSKSAWLQKRPAAEQIRHLPNVYLLLEHYLVDIEGNDPDLRVTLRQRIRSNFPDLIAEPGFGLIFSANPLQEVLLCRELLRRILLRGITLLGDTSSQPLSPALEWLSAVPESIGAVPFGIEAPAEPQEGCWIQLIEQVSQQLATYLDSVLGDAGTDRIYEAAFRELLDVYGSLETFPVVIGMLPDRLLDEDKIVLLSRRQVQRVLLDTAERLKRANGRLTDQNGELREAQDELHRGKEQLEVRIQERTKELRGANDQLRTEINERIRAEDALKQSELYFRSLLENSLDLIFVLTEECKVSYVSPSVERLLGLNPASVLGTAALELVHPDDVERVQLALEQLVADGDLPGTLQCRIARDDGTWRIWEIRASNLLSDPVVDGIIVNAQDVTSRRQLELQLHQSQKMEAVGRLAGGVAHDFNNLLTAIKGHTEFLLEDLEEGTESREDAEEIGHSADRAAALTRQLLAFSRRQVFQPEQVNLNETVSNMEKMLRRLIGEDVTLAAAIDPDLGQVKADPNQIEQVLMNLVVNARDAMPQGGLLTIQTANVELDDLYVRGHAQVASGSYVMLAVSDTGCGMDEETQAHLFEPFYTTKEQGKGTGLGLSTVYGIVKQSAGFVWVYSEPEQGTTFKIYLPRLDKVEVKAPVVPQPTPWTGGRETILLVEDEPSVRALTERVLERQGYTILAAENAQAALRIAANSTTPIHLMVTDVVMPGMGGRALAEQLRANRPEVEVLYMSGYTDDAILRHGMLDEGTAFLEKPFTPDGLARKVREILDRTEVKAGRVA
ncbi:MAG TPA: ATP-binding protein [Longimicrobiaceae bacterium]|nr:ATP-binding protein [Longimicrobiaceae bacterium]